MKRNIKKIILSGIMLLSLSACNSNSKNEWTDEEKETWATSNGYIKGETALSQWAIANGYLKDETALANWATSHGYLKDETALSQWAVSNGYLKDVTALANWATSHGYVLSPTEQDYAQWAIDHGYLKDTEALSQWAVSNGYLKDEAALANWAIAHGYLKDEAALANWAVNHGYIIQPTDEEYEAWAKSHGFVRVDELDDLGYVKEQGYRTSLLRNVTSLNYFEPTEEGKAIFGNVIEGLVEEDSYNRIQPALAKNWTNNGKEWTFTLREGVNWVDKNGSVYAEVTAKDWVTGLKYALESDSVDYMIVDFIENAQEYLLAQEYLEAKTDATRIRTEFFERYAVGYNEMAAKAEIPSIVWNSEEDEAAFNELLETYASFDNVGVEAIGNYTIKYNTVEENAAFIHALINSAYFPVNSEFISDIGYENFGKNIDSILFNGPYIMSSWMNNERIALVKNDRYWDFDDVRIKYLNYVISKDKSAIELYEEGKIDSVIISQNDSEAWDKYVIGIGGNGNVTNPATGYSFEDEIGVGSSYLMLFNRNYDYSMVEKYPNMFKTTLTEDEVEKGNLLLSNLNIRKALLYGIDRSYYQSRYNNEDEFLTNTFVPRGFSNDEHGKDYYDYYVDAYTERFGGMKEEVSDKLKPGYDGITDLSKSREYLMAAYNELKGTISFPVKLEYAGLPDASSAVHETEMIKKWNEDLMLTVGNDRIQVIEIVRNNAITTEMDYLYVSNYATSHLCIIGWSPDYGDPITYLGQFTRNGTFSSFTGINNVNDELIVEYENLLKTINTEHDISKRLELLAEAEVHIIYDYAIAIPWYIPNRGTKVMIGNVVPFQSNKNNLKGMKIVDGIISQEDMLLYKEKYEEGLQ